MRSRFLTWTLFSVAFACVAAVAPAPAAPAAAARRVTLPAAAGRAIPFTVEVPAGWVAREAAGAPGVWLGPAGARPDGEAPMLQVLPSAAPLGDPAEVAAAIRSAGPMAHGWSAPVVEEREVAGLHGVLVQLDSGEGETARTTLALKLPAPAGSVAFMISARRAEFARRRPLFTSILLSVRPAAPAPAR
jgi:hypothetical protein